MVQEWVPGDHLTMVKNPDYWNAGRPLVDEAEVKIFADEGALVSALEGGVIDIALSFPPREYERLKDSFTFLQGQPGANFYYLGLNAKLPPFDNKLVRQAMAHAIDRETMVQNVLFGIGAPIMTPFPDFSPAYFPEHNELYPFDLDKAKALLRRPVATASDSPSRRPVASRSSASSPRSCRRTWRRSVSRSRSNRWTPLSGTRS